MADGMIEVAKATVTIIPNMQGAQSEIAEQLGAIAEPAGKEAGDITGDNLISAISEKLSGAGTTLTAAVTAPIVAAGLGAVKAFKDVDSGADIIAKKTGASGEALAEMEGIMNSIATTVPSGFDEVGSAVGEVNTRFGLTGQELESLSTAFVKFAQLNGTDVSNSVDSVSKVLAAFGMDAGSAASYLDALNVVGQQTGVDVGTLTTQVAANAAQFQQMGLTAYDAANFLGQADMAGIESSTMLMGLKLAMANAANEGTTLDAALAGFSTTMSGNSSETDKLAMAYELFGTRAGAAIYNAVTTGQLSLTELQGSLTGFEGSVSTTFQTTLDPLTQFTTVLNDFKILGTELFTAIAPALSSALSGLSEVLRGLTSWWQSLNPQTQEWIVKIALAAATIGPLLLIGSKLISSVSGIASGIGGLIGKFTSFGGSAATAASGAGTAAASFGSLAGKALMLVAAGAAVLMIASAISMLANAAIELSAAGPGAVATFALLAAAGIGMTAAIVAIGAASTVSAVGLLALGAAVLLVSAGVALIVTSLTAFVQQLPLVAEYGGSGAAALLALSGAMLAITGASLALAAGLVVLGVAAAASFIPFLGVDATIGLLDLAMVGLVFTLGLVVVEFGLMSAALLLVTAELEKIKNDAATAAESLSSMVKAVDVIKTGLNALGSLIGGFLKGIVNAISGATPDAAAAAKSLATNIVSSLGTGLEPVGNRVSEKMRSVKMALTNSAADAYRQSQLIGRNIVRGIGDGLMDLSSILSTALLSVMSSINMLQMAFASTSFRFDQYVPLPHFYMSGSFDAKTGRVPNVGVQWYAKAAEQGALFSRPQIIGVGDAAQPELLIGEDKLREIVGTGQVTINVYPQKGQSEEAIANMVMRKMQHAVNRKGAVFA